MANSTRTSRISRNSILVFASIIVFATVGLVSFSKPQQDNMANLISGQPHSPLVELDLELERGGGMSKKTETLAINEVSSINYFNNHHFGRHKSDDDYACGAYWPFKATFIFGDGSRCDAIVTVPNKPGYLIITYPINPWSTDTLNDRQNFLDLDSVETKDLYEFFKKLDAYN